MTAHLLYLLQNSSYKLGSFHSEKLSFLWWFNKDFWPEKKPPFCLTIWFKYSSVLICPYNFKETLVDILLDNSTCFFKLLTRRKLLLICLNSPIFFQQSFLEDFRSFNWLALKMDLLVAWIITFYNLIFNLCRCL